MGCNNLTIILGAILVLLLCNRMSRNRKVVLIEPRENFTPTRMMLNPITGKEDSKCGVKYQLNSNRYLVTPESLKKKSCSCGRWCDCEEHTEEEQKWRTPYEPGANNTTQDLLWNKTSPRMILEDNSIRWDAYGPDAKYDAPHGLQSDSATVSRYLNNSLIIHNSSPYKSNYKCDVQKYKMGSKMKYLVGTGIRQQPDDELTHIVNNSL